MIDRRTFVAFAAGAFLLSPIAVRAQQTAKVPRIGVLLSGSTRVAVLWYPRQGGSDEEELRQTETAARQLGVAVQVVAVRDPSDFQGAYAEMVKQQASAVILIRGSFTEFHDKALLALALKHRLPSICEPAQWADDGCLMSYGPDYAHLWRADRVIQ